MKNGLINLLRNQRSGFYAYIYATRPNSCPRNVGLQNSFHLYVSRAAISGISVIAVLLALFYCTCFWANKLMMVVMMMVTMMTMMMMIVFRSLHFTSNVLLSHFVELLPGLCVSLLFHDHKYAYSYNAQLYCRVWVDTIVASTFCRLTNRCSFCVFVFFCSIKENSYCKCDWRWTISWSWNLG